jgi:hypothetical protein
MKWLFIDHEYHKRTGSAKFFLDIVRKSFSVGEHYYNRYYRTQVEKVAADYDGVIIWEFPISRKKFFFREKKNVFVPMYDNEWASFWQWKRIAWSGMGVISFCDKVSEHAKRCGVKNIIDVRYFPDPAELPQISGDPKRVFLWERGEVGRKNVERLFPSEAGFSFDIKPQDEILPRDVYLRRLAECGIVVAPRRKEGIGMAFLEAMAMGKCVVAHNDATMNEYIEDGQTGILFDAENPRAVDEIKVGNVAEKIPAACLWMRKRWLEDSALICEFISRQKAVAPSLGCRIMMALSYPLYLVEAIVHRVGSWCRKRAGF